MKTSGTIEKMIAFSNGNLHDISHFLKVYAFAKIIGEQENLDPATQKILEIAAVVHDIACPLCREKYGNTNGKAQEKEGPALARKFLHESGYDEPFIDRVCYLVGHHHTYTDVDGLDHQILLEADFLVNADESHLPDSSINNMKNSTFKTQTGIRLLQHVYSC